MRIIRYLIFLILFVSLGAIGFFPKALHLNSQAKPEYEDNLPAIIREDEFYSATALEQQGQSLVAAGNLGKIVHTRDNGKQWIELQSDTDLDVFDIQNWDSERLIAVGQQGLILRSTDGGETWSDVSAPYKQGVSQRGINKIIRISTRSGGHALGVGQWNMVMETTDYGQTWKRISPAEDLNLYGVDLVDGDRAFVVGEFGELMRGTRNDTGQWSWEKVRTPVDQTLKAIDFRTPQQGVAVGLNGLIIRTGDGGNSWEAVTEGDSPHLYDVAWSGDRWYAVGEGGQLVMADQQARDWNRTKLSEAEFGWFTRVEPLGDNSLFLAGQKLGIWKEGSWSIFG